MSIRFWAGLALLMTSFLVLAAGSGAVRKQVESSMLVTGSIHVEADGSVSRFGLDERDKLPPAVIGLIEKTVPGWKFEPVLINGAPVKAKANMSLRVVAKPLDAERHQVTIGSASFGQDTSDETVTSQTMTPPMYPSSAARSGAAGTVYLVLRIGKDGQVEDAIVEQVNLRVIASEPGMARWRQVLGRSALGAAKAWRFNPPRSGDASKAGFWSVRVPVEYRFENQLVPKYGQWEAYVPGPRETPPWLNHDEMSSTGADALVAGSVYQIGRGLRLLTPLGAG